MDPTEKTIILDEDNESVRKKFDEYLKELGIDLTDIESDEEEEEEEDNE